MLADGRSQRYDWEQRVVQCGVRAKEQFTAGRVLCARNARVVLRCGIWHAEREQPLCSVACGERDSKLAMIRENIWGESVR